MALKTIDEIANHTSDNFFFCRGMSSADISSPPPPPFFLRFRISIIMAPMAPMAWTRSVKLVYLYVSEPVISTL